MILLFHTSASSSTCICMSEATLETVLTVSVSWCYQWFYCSLHTWYCSLYMRYNLSFFIGNTCRVGPIKEKHGTAISHSFRHQITPCTNDWLFFRILRNCVNHFLKNIFGEGIFCAFCHTYSNHAN